MKITFIGSGAAFSTNNYHSNMLITSNNKHLLIDCGSDTRFSLKDAGYSYKDIDSVYVSHLHADHVGGLEWLGLTNKFTSLEHRRPALIAHKNILNSLWTHCLSGGMETLETELATLETFFIPQYLDYPGNFQWENIKFQLVKTVHVKSNHHLMDSYGLYFTTANSKIFLTTDTTLVIEEFLPYYEQSDVIFHDCETQSLKSSVHSHYTELVQLPLNIRNKMWLYHYNTGDLPDAKNDGFLGYVQKGQIFEF